MRTRTGPNARGSCGEVDQVETQCSEPAACAPAARMVRPARIVKPKMQLNEIRCFISIKSIREKQFRQPWRQSYIAGASPSTEFHERYIPALDGVRGVAILFVLLHHCRSLLNPHFYIQNILIRFFELGWCGVELFFVLSGFLITGILLDSRNSPNYFSTFYARRILRIFPIYYAYLALVFVGLRIWHDVSGVGNPAAHIDPWWYLTYLQNFRPNTMLLDAYLGHLWSLAIEEQFYLVWPLLVLLVNRNVLTWICLSLFPASLIIRLHYAGHSGPLAQFVNTFTPASLDSLAAGALLAIVIRNPDWLRRARSIVHPLIAGSLIWFSILAWRSGSLFEYFPLIQSWGITALTLLFAGVIFLAATSRHGILTAILNVKPLRFIGKISYGLYVLHPLVIGMLLPLFAAVPANAAVDFALNSEKIAIILLTSIAVAAASWFLFEKPILELKKHFRYAQPAPSRNDEVMALAAGDQ